MLFLGDRDRGLERCLYLPGIWPSGKVPLYRQNPLWIRGHNVGEWVTYKLPLYRQNPLWIRGHNVGEWVTYKLPLYRQNPLWIRGHNVGEWVTYKVPQAPALDLPYGFCFSPPWAETVPLPPDSSLIRLTFQIALLLAVTS
ncbi:hypothetical protein XENTR_v10004575 [Xenopus tropicalis]|nr:hypothetical protein XENTR_v10004575 [Xenopus tropicalis]